MQAVLEDGSDNMSSDQVASRTSPPSSRLGIYVHIPFCEKKCFYCDFYSLENHEQRDEFIEAIVKELELFGKKYTKPEADTIFFGGGTPSLLKPSELERILTAMRSAFRISDALEFTLECNPGAVDTEYLSDYRSLGVNRLSFGVQSFFDDELRFLSRIHNSEEASNAVDQARKAGFTNINIDLIYGLPGQPEQRVLSNLQKAVALGTEHISAYNLIVEPGTPLFTSVMKGEIVPSEERIEAEMYESVMELLEKNGYDHYEISNYSRQGFECKHNLKYWNAEEYAGFGPSAHSYINGERWWNVSSLSSYLSELGESKLPVSAKETLTRTQFLDEFVLLHLRQGKLDAGELKRRFSVILDPDLVAALQAAGYCTLTHDSLRLTRRGFIVSDEIAETILARHLRTE